MPKPRRPPFATGSVVESYDFLYAYWEEARESGDEAAVEESMLSREDFDSLQRLVEEGVYSLEELLSTLTERFKARVKPELAARALGRLGLSVGGEEAAHLVARQLAAWLVEAGEHWGILRLRRPWEPGGRRRG
ncbi:hypothetical protein [Stetteria hydrogenophila]